MGPWVGLALWVHGQAGQGSVKVGTALLQCHCIRGSWSRAGAEMGFWSLARAMVTARPGHVGVHKVLP